MAPVEATIFVVDDETLIATTLAVILRQRGFVAVSFNDPVAALNVAMLQPPDFLLSDVMMSPLNGFELAIQVQKVAPRCKVILFSGQAETVALMKNAEQEQQDFILLSKPFQPADLLSIIRTMQEGSVSPSEGDTAP